MALTWVSSLVVVRDQLRNSRHDVWRRAHADGPRFVEAHKRWTKIVGSERPRRLIEHLYEDVDIGLGDGEGPNGLGVLLPIRWRVRVDEDRFFARHLEGQPFRVQGGVESILNFGV